MASNSSSSNVTSIAEDAVSNSHGNQLSQVPFKRIIGLLQLLVIRLTTKNTPFSKKQLDLLYIMFNQASSAITGLNSSTRKDVFPSVFYGKIEKISSWVIDAGATDHMIGDGNLFYSYVPYSKNYKVCIANGSLSTVVGIGSVLLSQDKTLKFVLFGLNLSSRLIVQW